MGADKLAESYHLSFGLPVVTLRPFNTYGPRQSTRAVIPPSSASWPGRRVVRLGALRTTRDLLYDGHRGGLPSRRHGARRGGRGWRVPGRDRPGDLDRRPGAQDRRDVRRPAGGGGRRVPAPSRGSEVERLLGDAGLARRGPAGSRPRASTRTQGDCRVVPRSGQPARYRSDRAV
ncbi:NAD-dependent epimerase/dehydratase family protein [Micromonospora sp. BRA006-A]|nr:NAD-dependent epimerase/dehydratase family protein [Micromonospora sp. BRA006-A]